MKDEVKSVHLSFHPSSLPPSSLLFRCVCALRRSPCEAAPRNEKAVKFWGETSPPSALMMNAE